MISLQVKSIMVTNVVTFNRTASIKEIAKTMAKKNISCVVIVRRNVPIGLITERDILKKIVSKNKRIDGLIATDVMTENPITITEEENIFNAATMMEKYKIRRFPVVKGKTLKGLITETDVKHAMTVIAKHLNEKLIEFITNS